MIALAKPKRRCSRHLPPPIDQIEVVAVQVSSLPLVRQAKQRHGLAAAIRLGATPEEAQRLGRVLQVLDRAVVEPRKERP